jgi:AcrR family transcriptional regulator
LSIEKCIFVLVSPQRPTRQYSSPLREQQASRTRDLILDALTELLAEHRADEVSTRQIAERAGVSQPTVYRYFPDRTALVEGLADRIAQHEGAGTFTPPATVDEWVTWAVPAFLVADEHAVEATAEAVLNADPRRYSRASRERSRELHEAVERWLPELDPRDQTRIAALFRVLASSHTWLRMREEFGLTGAESGEIVAWAIRILTDAIRDGDLPELQR